MAGLASTNSKRAYQERVLIFLCHWLLSLTIGLAAVNSLWFLWHPSWRTLVQNIVLLLGGGIGWWCLQLTKRGQLGLATQLWASGGIFLSSLLTLALGQWFLLYGLVSLSPFVLMATFLEPDLSTRWALLGSIAYLAAIAVRYNLATSSDNFGLPDLASLYLFPVLALVAFALLGRNMGLALERVLSTLENIAHENAQLHTQARQKAIEHQQTVETLAAQTRFLQTVLDAIQDGISVLDTDLNIVRVNRTMEQWYAHNAPLVGAKCFQAYHNRQVACEPCASLRALKTGTHQTDIVPLTSPQSQEGWLELYAFPIREPTGEISGIVEYMRNITKRKQAQEALLQERTLLQTLIDHLPDSIYVKDRQSRFLINNAESMRRIGVSDQTTLLGKTDLDFFPTDMAQQWIDEEQEMMRTDQSVINQEYIVKNKFGTRWLRTTKVPFHTPQGQVVGLVGISHDITELKTVQAERETLIAQLQDALAQVKTLHGLLPICAHCKKIRTEQGNWQQIEVYVRDHSQAEFSHGLCPECARKLYPDIFPDEP
ncbi:MAG: PAS domain-containing protein [Anaerolineae bacterium]|nr:PAS domain-containing protein [Anaerolineae bacterium]